MTSIEYSDRDGIDCVLEEMYEIPKREDNPLRIIFQKEQEIVDHINRNGGVVKSITSGAISKRRFKRRRAKELKRLAKKHNVVL